MSFLQSVASNLPDLPNLGTTGLVEFETHPLTTANVVWINHRLLRDSKADYRSACTELIEQFAYRAPEMSGHKATSKKFFADRYGTTGFSHNGGGGRVGIAGKIQAKGIGRTPLIGVNANWLHSHGCMFLEEALREATMSEYYHRHVANVIYPVIAVIDAGWHLDSSRSPQSRCALLVRAYSPRLSYAQRAISFVPLSCDVQLSAHQDVQRCRSFILDFYGKQDFIARLANQIHDVGWTVGRCSTLGFEYGGILSSNFATNAELVDFGNFGAVETPRPRHLDPSTPFPAPMRSLSKIVESLCFYVCKFLKERGALSQSIAAARSAALSGYQSGLGTRRCRYELLQKSQMTRAAVQAKLHGFVSGHLNGRICLQEQMDALVGASHTC